MATPVEWLNEFQANTFVANTPPVNDTQIIGLSNGNFLVAWVETGTTGIGTQAGNDIVGVIYDAEGNIVEAAQRLNRFNTADDEDDFDIAATNDGGFMMVFVDDDISNSAQEAIIWQRHDATGAEMDTVTVASNVVAADVLENPRISVNNSTNVSFVTFGDNVGGNDNISAVRLSATGVVLTAEFNAAQNSIDDDRYAASAININGELVSVYLEDDGGTFGIEARVYNASGTLQHSTTVESTASSDPQVATLLNGNIVATWVDGTNVQYRVYDSDLTPVLGPFNVDTAGDTRNEPEIVALPDGGFVIVWDNDTDNTLEARRFNENGSVAATDTVTIIEPIPGTELAPDVGVTVDGRILFAWEEGDNAIASIWDTRGNTVDTVDYAALPVNFIEGDVITGGITATTINGDGGADTLLGQDGNDIINGDGGGDVIEGGGGNDTIDGGLAQDTIDGGTGNDTYIISEGHFGDIITDTSGSNTLDVSGRSDFNLVIDLDAGTYTNQNPGNTISGVNTIIGTQLGDEITSTFGTQTLNGEGGDDVFIHGNGQFIDDIDGGAGNADELDVTDVTNAAEGMDFNLRDEMWTGLGGTQDLISVEIVRGTQLADTFRGDVGSSFFGEGGDDSISFQSGDGIPDFDGGIGTDTADFSTFGGTDFYVDLGAGGYIFGSATFGAFSGDMVDFENYMGGGGVDYLKGNAANNVFDGNDGDDEAFGGDGNDVLRGDAGTDNLRGEGGNDVLSGDSENDILNGGDGEDLLFGGDGNDLMFGGADFDQIFGGAGTDKIFGGDANDIANGGADNDIINTGAGNDLVFAQTGNDLVFAQVGNDNVFGGDGNDKIFGGDGNDEINGGKGNDEIFGGAGIDEITGAAGNDIMSGGGDSDTFFLFANQGADSITDYTGADKLDISSFGVTDGMGSDQDWQGATTSVVTSGGGANVTINWVGGGSLVIENIGIASLTDVDFVF